MIFSNWHFFQKRKEQIRLYYFWYLRLTCLHLFFWKKLKTPKRYFEINWPLDATSKWLWPQCALWAWRVIVILCHGWCSRTLWCYYWGKRYPFPKRPCCLGRPFCLPSLACMAAAIIPTPRCIIQILAALVWKCSCLHNFFDILSFLKNLVLFFMARCMK